MAITRPRRMLMALAVLLTATLGLTACESAVSVQKRGIGRSLQPGQPIPKGGIIRVGVTDDLVPKTFLQIGTSSLGGMVAANVYDTLIRYAPDGLVPQPRLATSWSFDAAHTVLTLNLRQDVTYHDGRPFV
ncbi:MAG: ABC transporter substrate-binding protein, partial [Gordonia sp. (in: high G+C Gram-positive bacteria)]